jgi:hypothetical protein
MRPRVVVLQGSGAQVMEAAWPGARCGWSCRRLVLLGEVEQARLAWWRRTRWWLGALAR